MHGFKVAIPRRRLQIKESGIASSLDDLSRNKGVVENIKDAKDSMVVSKPKEFASRIQKTFGSADNIHVNTVWYMPESSSVATKTDDRGAHGRTLPANFRYDSDDKISHITSESVPGGGHKSPKLQSTHTNKTQAQSLNLGLIVREVAAHQDLMTKLRSQLQTVKCDIEAKHHELQQVLEEERYKSQNLEDQLNDLSELHQYEISNIKQELSSIEEKVEYQLEERTRDMADMLENCQTRITKMELQQQQQQLISMEGLENLDFRTLITKLINVVLAVLAVILVFVSTLTNMLAPFLNSRFRIITTAFLIVFLLALWRTQLRVSLPIYQTDGH